MGAKPKGIPMPKPSPKARGSDFPVLAGVLVFADSGVDPDVVVGGDVAVPALDDEVSTAI